MRLRPAWFIGALTAAVLTGCGGAGDKQPTAPEVDLGEMVEIQASTFRMGVDYETFGPYGDAWFIDQTPAHDVELTRYHIDINEVTVAQFAQFLTHAAGEAHFHPDQPIERVSGGYLPVAGTEQQPIRHVTWQAADHYCRWAGKQLPTEAQWEMAATGAEGRIYPWGDEGPSCLRTAFFTGASACVDGPVEVGSHPDGATPDGVHDLAGNVAEWVQDRYGPYSEDDQSDPQGPPDGPLRVVRGGGFVEGASAMRSATRRGADPAARSVELGFRCSYTTVPDDGALRGDLTAPADEGREPTDRPLAPAAEVPEILASGLVKPTSVVRVASDWYVLDQDGGAVLEITETGSQVVIEDLEGPTALASDGERLYLSFQDAGEVRAIDTDGGGDVVLATGQDAPGLLIAEDGEVFWAAADGIYRHTDTDGAVLLLAIEETTDLSLSDTDLYYTSTDGTTSGNELGRVPRDGGAPEILVDSISGSYLLTSLVHDEAGSTVYFLVQRTGWPGSVEICEVPAGAGDYACFAHGPPKGSRLSMGGDHLYWVGQYNVVRMDPVADWTYEVIGSWTTAGGLAASDGGVVWSDRATGELLGHSE